MKERLNSLSNHTKSYVGVVAVLAPLCKYGDVLNYKTGPALCSIATPYISLPGFNEMLGKGFLDWSQTIEGWNWDTVKALSAYFQ